MSNAIEANVLPFPHLMDSDSADGEFETLRLVRMVEAMVFASSEPVAEKSIAARLPEGTDVKELLGEVQSAYVNRGVNLVRVGDAWAFRTADDLSFLLQKEAVETRRLSKAALEVLAIIAYHQPVTRAEIEEIRGVVTSKGTLDVLMELGWLRLRGRRRTPGRPVTYGTTNGFLAHFNLETITDLPGRDDLKAAGLLDPRLPKDFEMPEPMMLDDLTVDEDPLDDETDPEFFEDFLDDHEDDA